MSFRRTAPAVFLLLALGLLAAGAAPAEPLPCLNGLDPVALTQGQEVPGDKTLSVVRHRYRYVFVSAANKAAFEQQPERYAIQLGGACARMGPLTGLGHPDRFWVHDGRIYLFASEQCRDGFKAAPEKHLDTDDVPLAGSDEEVQRGRLLLARALEGMGGAARVDAVTSYQTRVVNHYKTGEQQAEYVITDTAVFPDRFRHEQCWHSGSGAAVVRGGTGFRVERAESWTMDTSEVKFLLKDFHRHPLVLLKARNQPGFTAVAAGRGKVGEQEVELLQIGLHGATYTLGLDPASGRVVSLRHRGRVSGRVGDVVKTFADFRPVEGLTLPFSVAVASFDGQPSAIKPRTYQAVSVNLKVDDALFVEPK